MSLHPPTLLMAFAVALVLASVVSISIGLKQGRRGMGWWFAANAMLAAGLVVEATADPAEVAPIVAALALQWPIITLAGIRRFYARGGTRIAEWHDRIALALAIGAAIASWIEPIELASWAQVLAVGAFSLTLYAATAVAHLEDFATTSTLRTLRLGMVTGALAQGAWLAVLGAYPGHLVVSVADGALGALLATAAIALLMTQLAPVMTLERKITTLLASQRKLRNLVDVDALTRLPNRRHFHELAERSVEAARDAATMIVFDVDRLNRINELLGHANGDEALRQIGTALRETLRRRDVAGRLGGDEFAVVLPRTRLADSEIVVSRIIARIDDRQVAPRIARVTLNVGAVQLKPNETIGDALRRADAQLVAKRDAARRGEPAAEAAPEDYVADEATPTPSALMSLIPVGEVKVKVAPAA
ncbi:MAG TPA: GGDEF domain-containing protein [Caldimonas sp.]